MDDLFKSKPRYKCYHCGYKNRLYYKYIDHIQIHYQRGVYRKPSISNRKRLVCHLRLAKIQLTSIICPHHSLNLYFYYPNGYVKWFYSIQDVHNEFKLLVQFNELKIIEQSLFPMDQCS
jgi:hypothetical protein